MDDSNDELKLTAHRPEAHRYVRLAKVLENAEHSIREAGMYPQWEGALRQLDDSKGDLTAIWRNSDDCARFAKFIDNAWKEAGENGDDVVHDVVDK